MADSKEEHVWTQHAEEHKQYTQPYSQSDGFIIRKWLLEEKKPKSILIDFGCGSGLWRKQFDDVFSYTGLDQNAAMIEVAKSRDPKLAHMFTQVTEDKLPFADKSVDVIFTAAVIQHNKHDRKGIVLSEFHRVLKDDGIYVCTENTFRPDNYQSSFPKLKVWNDQLDDGYSFTRNGWESYMKEHGFQLDKYQDPGEYLYRKIK